MKGGRNPRANAYSRRINAQANAQARRQQRLKNEHEKIKGLLKQVLKNQIAMLTSNKIHYKTRDKLLRDSANLQDI